MPILLKSLQGVGHAINVSTKVSKKLNEDSSLDLTIIENASTFDAIGAITKMWTITHVEGEDDFNEYVIVILDKTTIGEKIRLDIKARQKELDDLNNSRIYQEYNESFTGVEFFNTVFKGTGYKYVLHPKVDASKFEGLGKGDTRLEIFKKGLERYHLEYEYDAKTKTFHLYDELSKFANYYIKAGVNADNVKIQEDASKCYTFIKGYGDFDGQQTFAEAGLQIEFTHPLAQLIGKREAPPLVDGRIKKEDSLKKAMELVIKKSVTASISLDFVALREHFPEANPKIGDVVRVVDSAIGYNDLVRIVEITTERDAYNNITKQDVVLGDFTRRNRYNKAVHDAANYVKSVKSTKSDPSKELKALNAKVNASLSINNDILKKTERLNAKVDKVNTKTVTTANGTIMYDFTSQSSIRNIKSIGTIGDSVARGSHAKTNFTEMLGKKLKAKTTNLARGGATMATVPIGKEAVENSIYRQAEQIRGDLIILQGTDDDWLHGYWAGVPIGTDKTDTKTFYGAFCSAIEVIRKNNPDSKILVMTATRQCPMDGTKIRRKDTDKNKLGLTLEDYVNAQVLACSELNVPVFDAYHTDYFKPYNPAFRKSSMPDGLHPNEKGHEVIMYELIKDYYSFYD
ncbi:SGNH/GDSL hydrolase family protein [Staphylococcus aureus]|uniref:SGNH/GDSL hydrolase family protein n=1 Tax=Staphylococcus aureus TaxID=1280 RepID=UPI00294A45E0|nr:SGNH/GDSL hydrolase family protein [Staphylococcus aureus]MDV5920633.1 SGNH/GDSL hydrolase family protein [Staphylococcus aureus]MDV5930920.1 SGNH/GDSL hydrolase family protein [Staphylococcus aureus]MDV5936062.1 SGNH/GDSL hydrolase family protein [Staphylococcus aureus]MDV5943072.1 SGNH/GDSL hydrolase family protein [Staphylococcus aureus]MDV5944602.1 SGNH/GDSL hydrolase family protein [Staphylococcus aureus]